MEARSPARRALAAGDDSADRADPVGRADSADRWDAVARAAPMACGRVVPEGRLDRWADLAGSDK